MSPVSDPARPFGRLLTAMVTPFDDAGALDLDAAAALAAHLVDDQANDGLVISGTTGESPTTSDEEKQQLLAAVVAAVGDRAHVLAGVGTADTAHSVRLARRAADAGADGVLLVTPYYSRPPRAGLVEHFLTVAEATALPVLLYDIPHRSGIPIPTDVLLEVAAHPRIVGVKDAKGDLVAAGAVMAEVARRGDRFAYYCGDDAMTLPLLAVGGVGMVGTSTHFSGRLAAAMIDAYERGDVGGALELHRRAEPTFTGVFATQGCTLVKAGLAARGHRVGGLRRPQVEATPEQLAAFESCLRASEL